MNILLTGASGFVGRHIRAALEAGGHRVISAVSARHSQHLSGSISVDFAHDSSMTVWQERFERIPTPIDIVINAVGVLRDTHARPIAAIHQHTPIALFDACARAGVARVIHISALGIEHSSTLYASTKRAADEHLLMLAETDKLQATILRPSIIFGAGGASSQLFMHLARLPLLVLPQPVLTAQVQPVAVTDVAAAVAALVASPTPPAGIVPIVGPEPVQLGSLIASLRQQLGHSPAPMLRLPDMFTRLSARIGDTLPFSPWCSESLALLGADNIGDCAALRQLLGREATHYRAFVTTVWKRA